MMERMRLLGDVAQELTSLAIWEDAATIATVGRYPLALLDTSKTCRL